MSTQTHFGDPCIHCGTPHDDVEPGACKGDPQNAKPLVYCVARQAWNNPGSRCMTLVAMMSTGDIRQDARHPSDWGWIEWYRDAETMAPHAFRARFKKQIGDQFIHWDR